MKRYLKNPSSFDKGARQETKKIGNVAGAEKSLTGERIAANKNENHGHDPEYYHSDNRQNRIRPGKRSPAQSPNKSAEESE